MTADEVLTVWAALVGQWVRAEQRDAEQLLRAALDDGVPRPAEVALPDLLDETWIEDSLRCAIALISLAGAFDAEAYRAANPYVVEWDVDPLYNYCRRGWRNLRNPSHDLDGWWYTSTHLDPADDRLDPLLHFLLVGRHAGLATRPERRTRPGPVSGPVPPAAGQPVRRACLVAAYDVDGLLDETLVGQVSELSRFADVWLLADCVLEPGELDRLTGLVEGAWAVPHGTGAVGSHSLLARELVGWDVLDTYDEVVLVDDSAYLVRPLDEVFAAMDATACDWWGLLLTAPRFAGVGPDHLPMPVPDALAARPATSLAYEEFPRVELSFLALRAPALADAGLRRRLDAVVRQSNPDNVVLKYDTALTRHLLDEGFTLATYAADVHPHRPLVGASAFDLVERGLPVLSCELLVLDPEDVPDLRDWRERLLAVAPHAPVDAIGHHLDRVAPADELQRTFAITTRADGTVDAPVLLTNREFRQADAATETHDHWWAFPVCAYEHTFAGNERAVFEEVRDDPSITKIVLTRSRRVEVSGANVVVVPLRSPQGQQHLLRAGRVFVKHGARINIPYPLDTDRHQIINLWHGIPLKRFGNASVDAHLRHEKVTREHLRSHAVVVSSKMDRLAMAAAFHPLTVNDLWPTGLPRNDFILREQHLLPPDLQAAHQRLTDELAGRRLVMFLPTYKQDQADAYYRFGPAEIDWLRDWSARHHAVLGVREHMADTAHTYAHMLSPLDPVNLSARRYPDLEVVYRSSSALITDYSSCLVDYLLTGRPVASFAYDQDRYADTERGLFYDLPRVLPGPVCGDFDALATWLDTVFDEPDPAQVEDYTWKRRLFFDHLDDHNAHRVVDRVRSIG